MGRPNASIAPVRLRLVGANPDARMTGVEGLPAKASCLCGDDQSQGRASAAACAKVRFQQVYRGIDLVFYVNDQQELEYDFVVAPGADPGQIALRFDGAERVELDAKGNLLVHTAAGLICQHKPRIYQLVRGERRDVEGGYVVEARTDGVSGLNHGRALRDDRPLVTADPPLIKFQLAAYDPGLPLVIDPVISFSTYLGGSQMDVVNDLAVDAAGNLYVLGTTTSRDFPASHRIGTAGYRDVFLAKLSPDGSRLLYALLFGGSHEETPQALAVDADGNAWIGGATSSGDLPCVAPIQSFRASHTDAFLAKISADGTTLLFSTYLGGLGLDSVKDIVLDAAGNAYVCGWTESPDFPALNSLQPRPTPADTGTLLETDAFVAKLNPSGSALEFSTLLGGSRYDGARAIGLDAAGNLFVTGGSDSWDFPAVHPVCGALAVGTEAPFLAKLDSAGSTLLYCMLLAEGRGVSRSLTVDAHGDVVLGGPCDGVPMVNPPLPTTAYNQAFISKLDGDFAEFCYSWRFGGSQPDGCAA